MVKASTNGNRTGLQPLASVLAAGIAVATLVSAGCSTMFVQQEAQRGHLLADSDIQQVQPGMSQEQVRGILGTPDTTATSGPATYYYMSSTLRGAAFMEPTEVERHILAIYFTPFGTVTQVANYTLKDGKVIDTIGRTTASAHGDKSLIDKLFKGIGKKEQLFDPGKGT